MKKLTAKILARDHGVLSAAFVWVSAVISLFDTCIYKYIPSGGKPRQRFERFLKKCRFRHSEASDDQFKFV